MEPAATDSIAMKPLSGASTRSAAPINVEEEEESNEGGLDTVTSTSVTIQEADTHSHNNSLTPTVKATNKEHHRDIYWPTPAKMVFFYIFGLSCSVAHHYYYRSRNGKMVGTLDDQQWALRAGTIFAFLVQACLVFSVCYAYTQWLWKTLKDTKISIKALNAAFDADSSLHSFLNKEMLCKMRVGALIAIIALLTPLASLVTPATLTVHEGSYSDSTTANVASLDMSSFDLSRNIDQPDLFSASVAMNGLTSTNDSSQVFVGPRTFISRLSVATASTGKILTINPPFLNSTYQLKFYGPKVECEDADPSVVEIIDDLIEACILAPGAAAIAKEIDYFAFVPVQSPLSNVSTNSTSILGYNVSAILGNRADQPANATNMLWMAFSRYNNGSSCFQDSSFQDSSNIYRKHIVCSLWNASYTVNFTFENGVQTINAINYTLLGEVAYPMVNASAPSNLTQFAYSAYMWAFTNQIIGYLGLYSEKLANGSAGANYAQFQTQIQDTSLLGSSDLDVFFDRHHLWINGAPECTPSDQRLQDINLARNESLDVLIPELSFNTTMSFFSSDLLSPFVETNVTTTSIVNYYSYHSSILILSYALANFFALLAIMLGGLAFYLNGVSHDRSFSSILSSTRDPNLASIFGSQVLGKLPLPEAVSATSLIFVAMGKEGGLGLRLVNPT